jgi:glycosyltransferase involved in cell wall biosynthesis
MSDMLPKISVAIPTYNEEENIERCLSSVFGQDYPTELLEVFVLDGGSMDRTVELAKQYPIIYLFNEKRDAESAKVLGFEQATGDLFFYLDADLDLACRDWFQQLIFPLQEDSRIAGSFTRFVPYPDDPPLNRYLSYHELQLDPMLEYLCPALSDTIVETRERYHVCDFQPGKSPPVGICLYRMERLRPLVEQSAEFVWVDIAIPILLSRHGHNLFAYVPNAGVHHLTVKCMDDMYKKKHRDANNTYLPAVGNREFTYVNYDNPCDLLRLAWWVLYANLVVPGLCKGIYKAISYRDWACLYEVPTTTLLTDYIIWLFLRNPHGRDLIVRALRRIALVSHGHIKRNNT